LAGTPPAIEYGGTSHETIAPAAITEPFLTMVPSNKTTCAAIQTSSSVKTPPLPSKSGCWFIGMSVLSSL